MIWDTQGDIMEAWLGNPEKRWGLVEVERKHPINKQLVFCSFSTVSMYKKDSVDTQQQYRDSKNGHTEGWKCPLVKLP